mmetsp:Transcript_13318/g.19208  ORF Transcript_13318/g.19208 Transcript_13318/m.19208 type:complete len:594 (-) Transcript_13318:126-1907(-)
MRRFGKTALHALLAMWVLELVIDQWSVHTLHRGLDTEEESVDVDYDERRLVKFLEYELLAGGNCVDSNGKKYESLMLFVDATGCALECDKYAGCRGFDTTGLSQICMIYFDAGTTPAATFPPFPVPGEGGVGEIVGSDHKNTRASCFFKRRTPDDGIIYLDNYEVFGTGDCEDSAGSAYSSLAFYLGGGSEVGDCATKCSGFTGNLGFTWRLGDHLCLCHYNAEDLPYDPNNPDTLAAIPGACTQEMLSAQAEGECAITLTGTTPDAICYVNKLAPVCGDDEEVSLLGGVSGDPLFMGLNGQVFKFEGRSGGWYSNVSTKKLQWNLRFKEFETCPKGENMFVTGTTISLNHLSGLPFKKPEVAHTISIMVNDEDKFFPGCQSGVCLGDGSLKISVDGNTDITSPGDYKIGNDGVRVIAHNTLSACSRKWYDFVEHDMGVSEDERGRLLEKMTPLEFLNGDKGDMLDPKKCTSWMKDRARDDDLFSQEGGWSTIHIKTPTISFHVEYRQNRETCNSHNIDAWISEISPVLLDEEWQGVLGETREEKFYPDGKLVTSERSYLLSAKDDKDYEVDGPFGDKFAAQKKSHNLNMRDH